MSDQFCLRWDDFQANIMEYFKEMKIESNSCDVTIALDDDTVIKAHKFVLSACSPFLKGILKKSNHPHPFIFLSGMKASDLISVVDFM